MTANPHNIKNGERLPMVGGPRDGDTYAVEVLFPFLNGGCPSGCVRFGGPLGYWYELDAANRQWVFKGVTQQKESR